LNSCSIVKIGFSRTGKMMEKGGERRGKGEDAMRGADAMRAFIRLPTDAKASSG
jgi:hypothetical protein